MPEDAQIDRHRPRYHVTAPQNWLNDPNGLIQWNGTYHMFYQYTPDNPLGGVKVWGHAISGDLVHWEHLPVALEPEAGGPDEGGCWSGCAFEAHGRPTIIYSGFGPEKGQIQHPCVAVSHDELLQTWNRTAQNPVIEGPPIDVDAVIFRDHTVWRDGDHWYQGIGSGIRGQGGTVLVYRSIDLTNWTYLHPLIVGDSTATDPPTGTAWECPDFFATDGRHALIFSSMGNGVSNVAWIVGDLVGQQLMPTATGLVEPGPSFYAPQSFTDDSGRRVMFGWLRERWSDRRQVEAGWSGAMTLPRLLSVSASGRLETAPAPENDLLRGGVTHVTGADLDANGIVTNAGGDAIEIVATFAPTTETVGLIVRADAGTGERTTITYDPASASLTLDTTEASTDPDARGATSVLDVPSADDGTVRIRVYVDRSIVEVFVNDRVAVSDRVYPTSASATALGVIGSTALRTFDVWNMDR